MSAEEIEEVAGDHGAGGGAGLAGLQNGSAEGGLDGGEVVEAAGGGAPVAVVGVADLEAAIGPTHRMGANHDERRRVAEWRRPEQHGADEAEERGDGRDAEGEGERRGEGGRQVATQPAQGETEVEGCHRWFPEEGQVRPRIRPAETLPARGESQPEGTAGARA